MTRRQDRFTSAATAGLAAFLCLLALSVSGAGAASLAVVKPVMACGDVLKLDLSYLREAPTKLNSATVVTDGAPAPYCLVSGYARPASRFRSACRRRRGPSEW